MNRFYSYLLYISLLTLFCQSCVNKGYDWDELDKGGVIKIPPVPLGKIDTIFIHGLPEGDHSGIPIPDESIVRSDTIRGLFDESVVKKFFFEGADTVEISADMDLYLAIKGIKLDIYISIIGKDRKPIKEIVIPKQSLTLETNQKFEVKIEPQYMKYMKDASDLQLTIVLSSDEASIWIGEDDYIYFREAIIKTGGFYYDL